MQTNAANLSDRDIRDIADYFVAQSPIRAASPLDATKAAAGKVKASDLACAVCHLPSFHGRDDVPRLAGQTSSYVIAQLEAFASGKRRHGTVTAGAISAEDIEGLAHFFAQLE